MKSIISYYGQDRLQYGKFCETMNREYYTGEFLNRNELDLTIERSLTAPIVVSRMVNHAPLVFRRSWQHIRKNNKGTWVISFVRRGTLKIISSRGTSIVSEGHAVIYDPSESFHMEISDGESVYVVVPSHLFHSYLSDVNRFNAPWNIHDFDEPTAKLLGFLVNDGEVLLNSKVAELLAAGFLVSLNDSIHSQSMPVPKRQKIMDVRLADIEAHIIANLADPDLSCDAVAQNCNISTRYLSYLLKQKGMTYSAFVWKRRLANARNLLLARGTQDRLICEIAFMCGFKSAAHFSRMFKSTYGCSPCDYRTDLSGADQAESSH